MTGSTTISIDLPAAPDNGPRGRVVVDPVTGVATRWQAPARVPPPPGPMLARTYGEDSIWFPVMAQPKIDGVRCMMSRDGLMTRSGHRITSLPDLAAIAATLHDDIVLDGELHIPGETLETISAIAQQRQPSGRQDEVRFAVFDMIDRAWPTDPFRTRSAKLAHLMTRAPDTTAITLVATTDVADLARLDEHYAAMLAAGFEGQMIRDPDMPYRPGRSRRLIKRKPFRDAEAEFIGLEIGETSGLPQSLTARDCASGEEIRIAIQAMTDADREALALRPPQPGQLVTYRWQDTRSTHQRHCTLVCIHGPDGRL
jgi:DNA ligase-1